MAQVLVTKWFGSFVVDKDKVVRFTLFGKDPRSVAERLAAVQRGEVLPEEEKLASRGMHVAEPRLSKLGRTEVIDSSFIRPEDYGLGPQLMQKVMIELGKLRTREPLAPDRLIAQAVRALDDMIEIINLTSERLHEWYGLHFPELADHAAEEKYVRLVAEKASRDEVLSALALEIESVGSELEDEDLDAIRSLASSLALMYDEKRRLETYIADRMGAAAPNLASIVGPSLGARLISLAGSLDRLARLPSGTVQLLGAEKALFAHLRQGKRPPKHGVIFQHPTVHRAPYWQRGNIARAMAGKLSIAAKVDRYGGEFIGDQLNEQLALRVEEIIKKYPEPPARKPRPQPRPGGRPRSHQGSRDGVSRGPKRDGGDRKGGHRGKRR